MTPYGKELIVVVRFRDLSNVSSWPGLPTFASRQVVSCLGYTGCDGSVVGAAAPDPKPPFANSRSCKAEYHTLECSREVACAFIPSADRSGPRCILPDRVCSGLGGEQHGKDPAKRVKR
jgi:hypothetical protein